MTVQDPLTPVPSWQPGHFIWAGGTTKLVILSGIGTRTGDAQRVFSGLIHYLAERGGYDPQHDVLEGTFAGADVDGVWRPRPFTPTDTRQPLIEAAEAVAGCLDFYRQALPTHTRLCLLGYSMGGVVGLDGATLAVARDRQGWRDRLGAVVTLSAPVHGSSVGALVNLAWLVTRDLDGLGAAGRDLDARWRDSDEQTRLQRRAAFLRAAGATVLTLTDPGDSVVRPEESLLPGPGETVNDLQIATQVTRPGSLGHGAILDEPAVWRRVLATVGPQTRAPGEARQADPMDAELKELKDRLRRQGRIK